MPRATAAARAKAGSVDHPAALDLYVPLIRALSDATTAAAKARERARAAREALMKASYVYKCALLDRQESRRLEKTTTAAAQRALDDCRTSLQATHRGWRAAHPDATAQDHERFCAEVGELAGVSARQVARFLGCRMQRTDAERLEDYRFHLAGWSVREIARYRGMSPGSVQEALGRCGRAVRGRRHEVAAPAQGTHNTPVQNAATPPVRTGWVAGLCSGTG